MLGLAYTVAFVVTTGSAARAAVTFLAATAMNMIRQTHETPIVILWGLTKSTDVLFDIEVVDDLDPGGRATMPVSWKTSWPRVQPGSHGSRSWC